MMDPFNISIIIFSRLNQQVVVKFIMITNRQVFPFILFKQLSKFDALHDFQSSYFERTKYEYINEKIMMNKTLIEFLIN